MSISNANTITSKNLGGIYGATTASANGTGYAALGGTATATTTLTNSAPGTIVSTGDGIEGFATATANATGNNAAKKSTAKAGTATSTVTINNAPAITTQGPGADGLEGFSSAQANANAFTATGGTATATTNMSNSGSLVVMDNGIVGSSFAQADGAGSNAPGGAGTGGTATATTVITNGGSIIDKGIPPLPPQVVVEGSGIDGFSFAFANGFGYTAKGGTATAGTTITNTGPITSYIGSGIVGVAVSGAVGFAPVNTPGSAGTGGRHRCVVTCRCQRLWLYRKGRHGDGHFDRHQFR